MEATQAASAPGDDSAGDGLAEEEVLRRRARGEGNILAPPTSRSYVQILRGNFLSAINLILFTLGLTLMALGRATDAFLTAGIVFVNGLLGIVQEVRAKRLLDRIALLTLPRATVVRAGREYAVGLEELVRGDILVAGRGDQIVADGQVVLGEMEVDESLLTGEAAPISKGAGAVVYSGSFCTSGGARYVATHVGGGSFAISSRRAHAHFGRSRLHYSVRSTSSCA
jgi:cation-transporting ATPase E